MYQNTTLIYSSETTKPNLKENSDNTWNIGVCCRISRWTAQSV